MVAVDGNADAIRVGGKLDCVTRRFVGPPDDWETWSVGVGQIPPLLHEGGRFVCVGAMGAGKTEVLARACIARAILVGRNRAIGVVAPTQKRLRIIWQKIARLLRPAWVLETRLADGEIVLVNGCRLQFVAAKIYSRDVGSPIQGYSWCACYVDEEQDVDPDAMADVFMRGRDAPGGVYPVLSSCTLKDTPEWRERKQKYENERGTKIYRMSAHANPFVPPEYWESLKATLTERQYRMRVLALDARPERAVYPEFDRDRHVRDVPLVGARDVTRQITGRSYLLGYDPGAICDVTLVLRAFDIHGEPGPVWFVANELTTYSTTTEQHIGAVGEMLRTLDATPDDAIVVGDPYGDRQDETRPDVSVYKRWVLAGYKIRPAAYAKSKTGAGGRPGVVPKEAGIELVNTLLLNRAGQTRLYIGRDENGLPVAPKLVAALEMSERDESGKAEAQKKTVRDLSHWTAALRYSLHPFERIKINPHQWQIAQ